jgi:hypothetical protein
MNAQELSCDHTILTSHEILFGAPGGQLWGSVVRGCLILLACIVLAAFAGCIVIPTPEHGLLKGRGKIDESDIAFLEEGKTTREDVLLRFGEPDVVMGDQRILVYHWEVSKGYWLLVAGGPYGAGGVAGGDIPKNYLFMLEFDEEGRLKRFERSGSLWSKAQYRLDKWTPPDSEKLNRQIIMIDPTPEACTQAVTPGSLARPVRFQVGEFRDQRAAGNKGAFIGHKKAAFGVIVADVWTSRPAIDMVRAAIKAQLEAAGHNIVDRDADLTVTGEVKEFGLTTSVNLATWDAIGSLDVIVKLHPTPTTGESIIRRYQAKHTSKTLLGPSKAHFEQVMCACLEDMQKQMASDPDLARLLD